MKETQKGENEAYFVQNDIRVGPAWPPTTPPPAGTLIGSPPAEVRVFSTGATRDTAEGKLEYEGFFSPQVLQRRAQYMHKHRIQKDGSLRAPDNWQKGIALDAYADSLLRHMVDFWLYHRGVGYQVVEGDLEDVLCAIMFNAEGYLFELVKNEARR
ncbi:MAG: hypothetical protein ACREBG_09165 [Pyrinomonadaceae bacterium]